MELGGFAETPEVIDETEEGFEAFNYCLAEDYYSAMYEEDFELLGEVALDTIESVIYWLNYDDTINKDIEDKIALIPQGYFVTINNRPLYEAAIEANNLPFAEIFIYNGNHDKRLYRIVILQGYVPSYEKEDPLLNRIFYRRKKEIEIDEYVNFLRDIFELLEESYTSLSESSEKEAFLRQIRPYIAGIRIPTKFKEDVHLMELIKLQTYSWQKDLKRIHLN